MHVLILKVGRHGVLTLFILDHAAYLVSRVSALSVIGAEVVREHPSLAAACGFLSKCLVVE